MRHWRRSNWFQIVRWWDLNRLFRTNNSDWIWCWSFLGKIFTRKFVKQIWKYVYLIFYERTYNVLSSSRSFEFLNEFIKILLFQYWFVTEKVQYVPPIHGDIGDHYPWMKKEYLIKSYLIPSNLITTNLNSLVLILSISFNVTFSASILVSLIRWRFSLKPGRYYPNMSDSDWSRKVPGWDAGWKFPNCFFYISSKWKILMLHFCRLKQVA